MSPFSDHFLFPNPHPELKEALISFCQNLNEDIKDLWLFDFDYWLAAFSKDFIKYRNLNDLAKIIYQLGYLRKELEWQVSKYPQKRHAMLLMEPSIMTLPFSQKEILGCVFGIHINPDCEILIKEGISNAFSSCRFNGEFLEPFYTYSPPNRSVNLYYFEIGTPVKKDLDLFKKNFEEEVEKSIQPISPQLFMARNQEEVMHDLITLSKELQSSKDLPQVTLTYDEHDMQSMTFSVTIVHVEKIHFLSHLEGAKFKDIRTYQLGTTPDRFPIKGKVLRITLTDIRPFKRKNFAIDYYQARKHLGNLLLGIIGPFRDFNGGMLLKQDEKLIELKKLKKENHKEFIENFFYSLRPIERQATLPMDLLESFFTLFEHLSNPSEKPFVFDTFEQKIMIAIKGDLGKQILQNFIEEKKEVFQQIVSSNWTQENITFTGYILGCLTDQIDTCLQEIKGAVQTHLKKQAKLKILRLNNEFIELELDPRIGGGNESFAINKLLFDGLTRLDPKGKPVLACAESYQLSEDKRSYTFKLKELKWSNGTPLTAHDFEYAWKKLLSPTFQTRFAYMFYIIQNAKSAKTEELPLKDVGVKALNAKTLQVKLKHPAPYFLELVAHALFSPVCQSIDEIDPEWSTYRNERFICNGPFQLKKPRPFYNYELEKNPYYWDKERVLLDGVSVSNVNPRKALEMFNNKELDWLGFPFGISKNIFSDYPTEIQLPGISKVFWYCFNTTTFPLNQIEIRKAVFLSIDREKILKELPGNKKASYSPLPEVHSQISSSQKILEEDRNQAYELFCKGLKKLGLSEHTFPPLTILHLDTEQHSKISLIIKEQLEASLGIKCRLEAINYSTLFLRLTSRDYQIGAMRWVAWLNDPIYTLEAFQNKEEKINFIHWEDSTYQTLLDTSRKELDHKKRKELLAQAEKLLIKSYAILPLFYENEKVLKHTDLIMPYENSIGIVDFSYARFK